MTWSILSSALNTTSVPELLRRLFSFMRTVAELRPPRLYSVRSTTIGSLPCMMTFPARISWATFMTIFRWEGVCGREEEGAAGSWCEGCTKPSILASFGNKTQEPAAQVALLEQPGAPGGAMGAPRCE